MGTRSTIRFYEVHSDGIFEDKLIPLVNVYQQYDGYLEGVGKRLCLWLKNHYLVNGISSRDDVGCANGAGCLVAQFVHDFKREVGGLYIFPFEETDYGWIDYNYEVLIPFVNNRTDCGKAVTIKVYNWNEEEPFFNGTVDELLEEIKKLEEEEKK